MTEEKAKRKLVRAALELEDGNVMDVDAIRSHPEARRLIGSSAVVIKRHLKDALWGLSPLFGKDTLLAFAMEIMDEDDDADGPQTQQQSEVEWAEAEASVERNRAERESKT